MSNPQFEEPDIAEDPFESSATLDAAESTGGTPRESSGTSRFDFLKTLTVYDAMLIASAVSISLAVILMLLELTSFGGIFFQWRTGEAFAEPLNPPG